MQEFQLQLDLGYTFKFSINPDTDNLHLNIQSIEYFFLYLLIIGNSS
jgi:hypothetical protein